jgi:hypothetical protein
MKDLSGKNLRGYELEERIGSGGFGEVYRARQASVDREVAVKVILPEFAEHPDFVERFDAEARTVAKLEHPHIVPLYDYWHDDQSAFLVLRYLKGGSLRDRLDDKGALKLEELAAILDQICAALQVAHEAGVIHRDLKPENILLDERGDAYLTDFGIAKDLSADALTQTGKLTGSAGYLAPEQARAEAITPATDVYSLGILIYELLTGEHPFPDLTPIQLIQRHLSQPLPLVAEFQGELPTAIDELIQRATAKSAASRFASVTELAQSFRQSLSSSGPGDHPKLPGFLGSDAAEVAVRQEIFVGREPELAHLERLLAESHSDGGRICFITGGPGRGKTALSLNFASEARAAHPQLLVAMGSANAFSGLGDPYLPFREILSILTGEVETKWAAGQLSTQQARDLWEAIPISVGALLEHGPDLLDVFINAKELASRAALAGSPASHLNSLRAIAQSNGADGRNIQQAQLFEQYTKVLGAIASTRPLLLILDDLQWADGASISLLFHLGRKLEAARILLIGTYREEEVALGREGERHPLEKVVGEFRQALGEVRLELAGSDELDGRPLLEALLDSEPNRLGKSFRDSLYKRTGGHPLFTIELLRAMQERGDLAQDEDGKWVEGESLDWDRLPGRVEAAIEERVNRLETDLRELLSIASVEGDDFTAQVVASVQQVQERTLLRQLSQELEKRHRLVRERGEVQAGSRILARYRFGHHLFQHYLYNELSAGERRLLHKEVAKTLEQLYEGHLDEITVQLARHYQFAGDVAQAVAHLSRAGDRARRLYANQEALGHLDQALVLSSENQSEYSELLGARAAVLVELYRGKEAVQDYETLLERARSAGDDQAEIESLLGLARGNYIIALDHPETGAAEASQRFYKEAYERAGDISDRRGMIRALVPTLWFTDFWPDYESQARANAEEALALSQSIADKELELEAELAMFYTDPLLERNERGERLRAQLESASDLTRLNYLLFGLMFSTLAIGEFEQAVAHCDRGIELADRLGVPPVQYPTIKSIALARLGRFNEALDSLEQEIADESHRLASAFKELGRAIIYFELQAFRPAAELLLDLIQPAKELARAWMQDSIHLYLTRVVLEGGLLDEVDLGPSLAYLEGMDSAQAAVALGELALADNDFETALLQANRALEMAESSGRQPEGSMALELKAWVLLLDGQAEQALQAADDGIAASRRMGYRPMLWRLMGTRADALDALGRTDEAQSEREQATQLIEQLAKDIADAQLREIFLESAAVRSIFAKRKG